MRCMIDSKSAGSLACSAGLMACTLERLSASAGLKVHLCRNENMHEYVCVYMCICMYVYVCVCMCMYVYVCVCMCMYVYVYVCICMYVYVCVCMCMYMYVCVCMYMYVYVCICMYVYVWSSDRDGMELSPKDNQRGSSDLMMDGNCRRKTLRGVIRPTEGTGSSVETTTRGQQTSGWALPSLQGVIRSTDGTCQQLQGIGWRPLEQDKTASDGSEAPRAKQKD